MEILKTLAVALSLGSLAGLNLYLTVFVSGLAVRFDWVSLPAPLHGLEVLAHPIVIVLAGILYLFEFFADKIPVSFQIHHTSLLYQQQWELEPRNIF